MRRIDHWEWVLLPYQTFPPQAGAVTAAALVLAIVTIWVAVLT